MPDRLNAIRIALEILARDYFYLGAETYAEPNSDAKTQYFNEAQWKLIADKDKLLEAIKAYGCKHEKHKTRKNRKFNN